MTPSIVMLACVSFMVHQELPVATSFRSFKIPETIESSNTRKTLESPKLQLLLGPPKRPQTQVGVDSPRSIGESRPWLQWIVDHYDARLQGMRFASRIMSTALTTCKSSPKSSAGMHHFFASRIMSTALTTCKSSPNSSAGMHHLVVGPCRVTLRGPSLITEDLINLIRQEGDKRQLESEHVGEVSRPGRLPLMPNVWESRTTVSDLTVCPSFYSFLQYRPRSLPS